MLYRAPFLFGLAVLVGNIAGCAVTRPASSKDTQQWIVADSGPDSTINATRRSYRTSWGTDQPAQEAKAPPGAPPSEFEFSHPRVDDFVARFQTDLRGFFGRALERSARYVPRMSSILQKEGVPPELAYLPLIESGFQIRAVSRAGAVGPWQLIPGTGRRYGLRIDSYVDERRDPVKSTQAAARYLKDLHEMFGDWHLSLAAYNTGEGNISRIIDAGLAGDFWEMSDEGYLYRETENFVPEFLAALHIAETPEAYGFESPEAEPVRYDLVAVRRPLPLATVARLSGATAEEIKDLNPALHRGVVPPQGYTVRLPKGSKETFEVALANYHVEPRKAPARVTASRTRSRAIRKASASTRRGKVSRAKPVRHGKHTKRVVVAAARQPRVGTRRGSVIVTASDRKHTRTIAD